MFRPPAGSGMRPGVRPVRRAALATLHGHMMACTLRWRSMPCAALAVALLLELRKGLHAMLRVVQQ